MDGILSEISSESSESPESALENLSESLRIRGVNNSKKYLKLLKKNLRILKKNLEILEQVEKESQNLERNI